MASDCVTPPRCDYYVYALFRETGTPFYIGKGRDRRIDRHLYKQVTDKSKKSKIVSHMLSLGVDIPRVKIAECLSETDAHSVEMALISALGREPLGPLVNHTDGGPGAASLDHEAAKARRVALSGRKRTLESIAKTAAFWKGRKHSPETRLKMSAARSGMTLSDGHKAAISASGIGRKMKKESVERGAAKRRGRKQSAEHTEKTRTGLIGRVQSKDERSKRADAWHKSTKSKANLERISAANRGRKRTPQQIENLKAAWVRRKAKKS